MIPRIFEDIFASSDDSTGLYKCVNFYAWLGHAVIQEDAMQFHLERCPLATWLLSSPGLTVSLSQLRLTLSCHGIKTQGPKDQRPAPPREGGGP